MVLDQAESNHAMLSRDTILSLLTEPAQIFTVFKNTCICCLRCGMPLNVPQFTSGYITQKMPACVLPAFSLVFVSASFVASQPIVSSVRDWLPPTAVCLPGSSDLQSMLASLLLPFNSTITSHLWIIVKQNQVIGSIEVYFSIQAGCESPLSNLKKENTAGADMELFSFQLELIPGTTSVKDALTTNLYDNRANKYVSWGFTLLLHFIQFDIMTLVCQLTAMS